MCFCKILLTAQLRLLLSGECILLSLSRLNQNLKQQTLEPSACLGSLTDHVIALGVRVCRPTDAKRREWGTAGERDPRPLAPLFICFFLPLGLPYVNWASQECCLFYVRSSLQSSDLPLFYFRGPFPFFVF